MLIIVVLLVKLINMKNKILKGLLITLGLVIGATIGLMMIHFLGLRISQIDNIH